MLVSAWVDEYLRRVEGVLRGYANLPRYAELWKDALNGKSLRQVLTGDIERQKAARAKVVAPATVNRELAFIKRAFAVAMQEGLLDANPARPVKKFVENNARIPYLTDDEETRLREALGEDDWPLAAVAIHTGLRRSEQLNLRWAHVDFATGVVTVTRSKNGEARHVPMNDTVRTILRALPSRLKSEFVFPSASGETPIDGQNLANRIFVPAARRAKIEGLRWHDLRHTFASRLVMAGVDIRTVQELLGHKTIQMTLRYAHLSPGHRLEAVQRLNREPTATATATDVEGRCQAEGTSGQLRDLPRRNERARGESNTRPTDSKSAALSN